MHPGYGNGGSQKLGHDVKHMRPIHRPVRRILFLRTRVVVVVRVMQRNRCLLRNLQLRRGRSDCGRFVVPFSFLLLFHRYRPPLNPNFKSPQAMTLLPHSVLCCRWSLERVLQESSMCAHVMTDLLNHDMLGHRLVTMLSDSLSER